MTEKEKDKKARQLVDNNIYHNLCLTMEKELKENPDILLEAENYKEDEEGNWPEIMEWWAVSEWLGKQLLAKGEVVISDMLDFNVWGRQATGQAIAMDYVIEEIASV